MNPKIHKRLDNPPCRPIISQVGTVTYQLSKYVNKIIIDYLPKKHQVESTYELMTLLEQCNQPGMLASLDVESLFTNVPVNEKIDIIIDNVYRNPIKDPPTITENTLRELLLICTTRNPFRSTNGDLYLQKDGCSMGNPLAPSFANFYMCNFENRVFESYPEIRPKFYTHYVDDMCVLVSKFDDILKLKEIFELNSVLKFTFETQVSKKMPFLDVIIDRNFEPLRTSVHVKSTNAGDCLNYNSICPDRYKSGVIKTLLHRGYNVFNTWDEFHKEVDRIKQMLTNNNYPMKLIDNTVKVFLNNKIDPVDKENSDVIKLYFENQMSLNYKQDEHQLKNLIQRQLKPATNNSKISLIIFYKSKTIKNLFIKNKQFSHNDIGSRHHVVYQYACTKQGCSTLQNNCYIGYTECSLTDRFRTHTQNKSSIKKHLLEVHDIQRIKTVELLEDVKILKTGNNLTDLLFYEALYR